MDADRNGLEVLVPDEAHRIRETSANRYTPARFRNDRPQIDELISAARVPVFLLDEHQVVRANELGTVDDIEAHAKSLGLAVEKISLDALFPLRRQRGLSRLVCPPAGTGSRWAGNVGRRSCIQRARRGHCHTSWNTCSGRSSMRVRGSDGGWICWPWNDPHPDGTLVPDVVIGDWSRPWNLRGGDRAVGGAPPAALWATDPAGFGQVGCIYTAQGFEYDWSGVIIGPDLVWRGNRWVAKRDANKGSRIPQPDQGDRQRVRAARSQCLQSPADARHDRDGHLLTRPRDKRDAPLPRPARRVASRRGLIRRYRATGTVLRSLFEPSSVSRATMSASQA